MRDQIVRRLDYKHMLKAIKKDVAQLDNRFLVDTIFSIGKLHKAQISEEVAAESRLFPFIYYFIDEMLDQAVLRVEELEPLEIAYLLKGLTNLHSTVVSSDLVTEKEAVFRKQLLAHLNHDHTKVGSFDLYTVSKVLRYLLKYNDGSLEAQEVFKSFSLLLTQTVKGREASLVNSDLKDPLIDLEAHDIVDIVRIYATFAQ